MKGFDKNDNDNKNNLNTDKLKEMGQKTTDKLIEIRKSLGINEVVEFKLPKSSTVNKKDGNERG